MQEMAPQSTSSNREEFAAWVQEILARLYDSSFLQQHELTSLLSEEHDILRQSQELRRYYLDAIRSLRPAQGVPSQAPDWRAYRILQLRYIEGLTPQEVMAQIGLSRSHYFREQARAVQAVTNILWKQHEERSKRADERGSQVAQPRESLAHMEAERLCVNAVWRAWEVRELYRELRPMLLSLARVKQVAIDLTPISSFEVSHCDPIIFRQALLNLLSFALDIQGAVSVRVGYFTDMYWHGVEVVTQVREGCEERESPRDDGGQFSYRQGIGLEVCSHLTAAMKGRLQILARDDGQWIGRLAWHQNQVPALLLIDDNQSFHNLFQRYLANYNWQVIGATSGEEARQALSETPPTVIVLDVMMPGEDGWTLLEWLQTNESTRNIPVIICSVLNEPQLATMLGATAYLAKPVTQHALVHALSHWS